jgi:hypothetical protein
VNVNQYRSAIGACRAVKGGLGAVYIQEKAILRLVVLRVRSQGGIVGVLERLSIQGIQLAQQLGRVDSSASASEKRGDRLRSEVEPVGVLVRAFTVNASIVDD